MRRQCYLIAVGLCMLCGLAAQAGADNGPVLKRTNGTQLQPMTSVQLAQRSGATPAVQHKAALAGRKQAAPQWGELVQVDYNHGGSKQLTAEVTVTKTTDSTLTLSNLAGLGATLKGTYDAASGTIAITPAAIYTNQQMGYEVWPCPIDFVHMSYNPQASITGTVHADGTVTLGSWGLFIPSGTYANYSFGAYDSTQLVTYNATERDVLQGTDSVVTRRVLAEQTDAGTVAIFNLAGQGAAVDVKLQGGDVATMGVQYLGDDSYGWAVGTAKADYSKTTDPIDGRVLGTVSTGKIALGNWGVYVMPSMRSQNVVSGRSSVAFESSEITLDKLKLTLPAAPDQSWSGSGTEGDPYVISTAAQLHGLAVSVLQGNDYAGKTVALGADVNLGDFGDWLPIGDGPATPWQGTLDGRGHTVRALEVSTDYTPNFGLIGYAGAQSNIKDVKLSGFNVESYAYYGGTLAGVSLGKVSNVSVSGAELNFNMLGNAGVLGGYAGPLMDGVSFSGSIGTIASAAGVASSISGKASHLSAVGTISRQSGNGDLGGLVCNLTGEINAPAVLTDSYSTLEIYDNAGLASIGGLMGTATNATIERCFSTGSVTSNVTWSSLVAAAGSLGGLVGDADGLTMTDCYTTSLVSNGKESDQVGMIVGKIETDKGGLSIGAPKRMPELNNGRPCSFTRVLSLGMSDAYRPTATEAFYGTNGGSDTVFHQCYFDRQLLGNAFVGSGRGKLTSELTAGALEGYSTDVWQFTPGSYPTLRSLADVPAQVVASVPVKLGADEQMKLIKRNFTLSTKGGVTWQLFDAEKKTMSSSNSIMTISDSTATLKGVTGSGFLVASAPGNANVRKVLKYMVLKSGAFSGGDGSKSTPFLVSKPADWLELQQCVDEGIKFQNNYFKQTNDIDFSAAGSGTSTTFNGVANGANTMHVFGGDFDGGNYKLQNLHIKTIDIASDGTPDYYNAPMETGLFGIVTTGGRVHHVVMDTTCLVEGSYLVGAIAGSADGTVDHCANLGTVRAYASTAAGIAGYVETTGLVSDCFNGGPVVSGGTYSAGIAGENHGRVEYCQNNGTITASQLSPNPKAGKQSNVAGIVAYNDGSSTRVIGNINVGQIVSPNKASGIVDHWTTTTGATTVASGNINLGYVVNQSAVAADAGWLSAITEGNRTLSDNYNDAQIIRIAALHGTPTKGATNVDTRQLTGTTPLQGVDTAHVSLVAGQYPAIKWAAQVMPMAQVMRQMVVTLHEGEDLASVSHPAGLYKADGLVWSLKQGKDFSISGDSLVLTATDATQVRTDTLVATKDGYSREFVISSVAVDLEGNGSVDNPYLIKTVTDMHQVAHYTNDYNYGFNGKCLKLANDIDFTDSTYVVVGQGSNGFAGDFDGSGHQLLNVTLTSTTAPTGLFSTVTTTGRIHDLTLKSGTISGSSNVGGLVGKLQGSIDGCTNAATVTASATVAGGIAGQVDAGATITHCTNKGAVKAATEKTGGIAGNVDAGATLTACTNLGNLTATKTVGGIVGYTAAPVTGCLNQGNITGTENVAGIAASARITALNHNTNEGDVKGSKYVAGIMGLGSNAVTIDSCSNSGHITATGSVGGGIAAYVYEQYAGHVKHCTNTGTITGGKSVAGILGTSNTSSIGSSRSVHADYAISDCANLGAVTGTAQVAGVVARTCAPVQRCYNLGTISGSSYGIGGVVGDGTAFKMEESFNCGNVSSTATGLTKRQFVTNQYYGNAGGLVGSGYVYATDCFNTGTVSGHKAVGGLAGNGNSSFTRCYNAGRMVTFSDSAHVGILLANGMSTYPSKIQDVAYDKDVNPDVKLGATDLLCTPLSTNALSALQLGEAWTVRKGYYPSLASFDSVAASDYATATIVPEEGETYSKMVSMFRVGMPDSVTWSYDADSLTLENGKGGSLLAGDMTATKHYLGFSKTYRLHYDVASGFSGINDVMTPAVSVLQVRYVNLAGQVAREPWQGINVVVTTYSDGSVKSRKLLIKH